MKIKRIFKKYYNKAASRIYKFATLKVIYPLVYNFHKRKPIDDKKVLLIEVRSLSLTDSYAVLDRELKARGDIKISYQYLGETIVGVFGCLKRGLACIKELATAKAAFITDACQITSCVNLRKETRLIQIWHACGAFKKFGFSTALLKFGDSEKRMLKYPYYKNISYITVSSPDIVWAYEEAMNSRTFGSKVVPVGVSRTDLFFDKEFLNSAKERVYEAFPNARDKKVILYAPTFRGKVRSARTGMVDIERFYQELGDEYVLMIKHHPYVKNPPLINEIYSDFAVDLSKICDIEDLLCAADICISDYSSLVFEYSLFERPLIFFAYDIESYNDWRGFYYDYDELTPGPVFTTDEEIIEYIKNIDERFDKQRIIDFKDKFMSACDGNSTSRIIDLALGD